MDTGSPRAEKDARNHFKLVYDITRNAHDEAFGLVIDPLTDFKESEYTVYSTSPQESFNIALLDRRAQSPTTRPTTLIDIGSIKSETTTALREAVTSLPSSPLHSSRNLLGTILDSHLWTSDVSLTSGSWDSAGASRGGCAGGSSPHRLVVAEVHRFGYHPPCVGSPHDLATCPAPAAPPVCTRAKACDLKLKNEADPLKALSEASTALSLTETLIGPLGIPPVSQEVLDKVVHKMEKKASLPVLPHNGTLPNSARVEVPNSARVEGPKSARVEAEQNIADIQPSVTESNNTNLLGSVQSLDTPEMAPTDRRATGSSSSTVIDPPVKIHGKSLPPKSITSSGLVPVSQTSLVEELKSEKLVRTNSRVITVPVGVSDHGPVEVYREVHQYPASAITTTVERCSYIGQTESPRPPTSAAKRKCRSQKLKQKRSDHHTSQSSIESGSSVISTGTLVSHNSSELTPIMRSVASSKTSLNDTRSDSAGPVTRPVLSAALMQMRQALETVSVSDNHSDKSSGGAVSNFSDTSSNLSTLSDLSGYEDEYIRIKRLVSDAVIPPEDYKKMVSKSQSKSSVTKIQPLADYEKIIRDLQAQKEDQEIQLHRLSIQVQNAVREKELYQQQLELMHTKITETNQKQYFEVLKQRANLEGQLEMLKQELENSVYEKNQLQMKMAECQKESEDNKTAAASAKCVETDIRAVLEKYKNTNKELEDKLETAEERIQRMAKDNEASQRNTKDFIGKNEVLEIQVGQMKDKMMQMTDGTEALKSRLAQCQTEHDAQTRDKIEVESTANKALAEAQKTKASCLWYQEQLQAAQTARGQLQQNLLDVKSSLAKVSSEKDTFEMTVQTMKREAEDGQARAVREKASLLAHLEALQADMAEREALVSQLERDRGSDTKLMEDRRQRLEQDRQRIHTLKLDLADAERQLDFVRDDLKHKCSLLARYEAELKDLRTSVAVDQEVLGARDVRIENLEQTVKELKSSVNQHQEEGRLKDSSIAQLKEERMRLEAALTAANIEKREVDDAIIKVREDMTKLSSNFYRMKHDLAAKDRHIEALRKDLEDSQKTKEQLDKKYSELEKKSREDEERKQLLQEVEFLRQDVKESAVISEKNEAEKVGLKQTIKSLDIAKKGLMDAVQLREEQIQNMQASVENYREALLKKDEELYIAHEQNSLLEKNYIELRRDWDVLRDELVALKQDAEAYLEHEKLQKKEKTDLKESIQKERKLKQNLEKKIDSLVKVHEEEKLKCLSDKENVEGAVEELTKELQRIKEESKMAQTEKETFENREAELSKELKLSMEERVELDKKITEEERRNEHLRVSQVEKDEIIKSLRTQVDILTRSHHELKEKNSHIQSELTSQTMALKDTSEAKTKDVDILKKSNADAKVLLTSTTQEKNRLVEQVKTLLAENEQLKNVNATLMKEKCVLQEGNEGVKKKGGKNVENLQKELSMLQAKVKESDTRLKEVSKDKEGLEVRLKGTKRESVLMRAKMKEFESLKSKSQELESCKKKLQEYECLDVKLRGLETKIENQETDIITLTTSLNEMSSQNSVLKEREMELFSQIETITSEKQELVQRVSSLEEAHQIACAEIVQHQQQLKTVETEREEWMVKYESLRDIIPERDTSTQLAVQLGASDNSRNVAQEIALGRTPNDLDYMCDSLISSVGNGEQFDRTMKDLQAQVSLTSRALQSKEKLIQDLQHQLNLQQELIAPTSTSSSTVPKPHSMALETGQTQDYAATQQHASKDPSTNINDNTENQALLGRIKDLETETSTKGHQIEELETKIATTSKEFQEKQRRYESNVRLLTRKLKEHMKGRKTAEKEMYSQAEEHQQLLNEEQHRYSILRTRCLELEGRSESLEGQVSSMEGEADEMRGALERTQQEAYNHHSNTLALQKEMGRLQELSKASDSLRKEVSSVKESISLKDLQVQDLERVLQTIQEELSKSQTLAEAQKERVEVLEREREELKLKSEQIEAEMLSLTQTLTSKEDVILRSREEVGKLEEKNTELMNTLTVLEDSARQKTLEMQQVEEEKRQLLADLEASRISLQEHGGRMTALENQIKVVEGQLTITTEELSQVREQLATKTAAHQTTKEQLEGSVSSCRQEIAALTTQLGQVQRERVSYQTQMVELRMALHSALEQLKHQQAAMEAQEAAASSQISEAEILPSPAPLDLASLSQLMEKSARSHRTALPLTKLDTCLSSLKQEVATLQVQLKNKQEEMAQGATQDKGAARQETDIQSSPESAATAKP